MLNLAIEIKLSNIFNLAFGIILGFFLMLLLTCSIFSLIISKKNKNEEIKIISKRAYGEFYMSDKGMKDAIIYSLMYEINEVTKLVYPDKKNPLYELSFNNLVDGVNILQRKLKKVVSHPLFVDLKNIHITALLSIEKVAKPDNKVYNKKYIKILMVCYKITMYIINLFNPVFYMKKIMSKILIKKGKKEITILLLDFVGNSCYEIYIKSLE